MSSLERFAVLIVPGSWHVPAHYEPLIQHLKSKNIPASTLLLPTCDLSHASILDLQHTDLIGPPPSQPWPDMYTDALAVRKNLSRDIEAGLAVLLVAHSYGGLPASEALLPELCYKARKEQGKSGGVIGFFAIASFFLPPGMTTLQAVGDEPLPTTPVQPSGLHVITDPRNNLFNDLTAPEQDHWISLLRPQSWMVHETPLRNAGYLGVRCAYLKTELDLLTPIQGQRLGIAMARQMGANITEFTIDGGHDAFLGQPERCVHDIMEFGFKCLDS
ncbi:MAG: hypothetical protein Q9195_008079 [Heterodermia aff. obscurata]